jgi:hypothetical protein
LFLFLIWILICFNLCYTWYIFVPNKSNISLHHVAMFVKNSGFSIQNFLNLNGLGLNYYPSSHNRKIGQWSNPLYGSMSTKITY